MTSAPTDSPAEQPYATLAPYFARLFEPRGIRGWFRRARALVAAGGVTQGRHLDVGAGTCRYSRYWTRAGFRTVLSPEFFLDETRARSGLRCEAAAPCCHEPSVHRAGFCYGMKLRKRAAPKNLLGGYSAEVSTPPDRMRPDAGAARL